MSIETGGYREEYDLKERSNYYADRIDFFYYEIDKNPSLDELQKMRRDVDQLLIEYLTEKSGLTDLSSSTKRQKESWESVFNDINSLISEISGKINQLSSTGTDTARTSVFGSRRAPAGPAATRETIIPETEGDSGIKTEEEIRRDIAFSLGADHRDSQTKDVYHDVISHPEQHSLQEIKKIILRIEANTAISESERLELIEIISEDIKKSGVSFKRIASFIGSEDLLAPYMSARESSASTASESKVPSDMENYVRLYLKEADGHGYSLTSMVEKFFAGLLKTSDNVQGMASKEAFRLRVDEFKKSFINQEDFINFKQLLCEGNGSYLSMVSNEILIADNLNTRQLIAKISKLKEGVNRNEGALINNFNFNSNPHLYGEYFNYDNFDTHNWRFFPGKEKREDGKDKLGVVAKIVSAAYSLMRKPSTGIYPDGSPVPATEKRFSANGKRDDRFSGELIDYIVSCNNLTDHEGKPLGFNLKADFEAMLSKSESGEKKEQIIDTFKLLAVFVLSRDNAGLHAENWIRMREFAAPSLPDECYTEHDKKQTFVKTVYDSSKPKSGPSAQKNFITDFSKLQDITYDTNSSKYYSKKSREALLRGNNVLNVRQWVLDYMQYLHPAFSKRGKNGLTIQEQITYTPLHFDDDSYNTWDFFNPNNPQGQGNGGSETNIGSIQIFEETDGALAKISEITMSWPDINDQVNLKKKFQDLGSQCSKLKSAVPGGYVKPGPERGRLKPIQRKYLYLFDQALSEIKYYTVKCLMQLKQEDVPYGAGFFSYGYAEKQNRETYLQESRNLLSLIESGFGSGFEVSNPAITEELTDFLENNSDIFVNNNVQITETIKNNEADFIVKTLKHFSESKEFYTYIKSIQENLSRPKEGLMRQIVHQGITGGNVSVDDALDLIAKAKTWSDKVKVMERLSSSKSSAAYFLPSVRQMSPL